MFAVFFSPKTPQATPGPNPCPTSGTVSLSSSPITAQWWSSRSGRWQRPPIGRRAGESRWFLWQGGRFGFFLSFCLSMARYGQPEKTGVKEKMKKDVCFLVT